MINRKCKRALIICGFLTFIIIPAIFASDVCAFKFAVWGDSQFDNPDIFARAVKETSLLKPAFVIQCGDMINGYTYDRQKIKKEWERFRQEIAPLSSSFYPVPGNHDVTTTPIEPLYGETWGKDRYYYSFDYNANSAEAAAKAGKSHFIILDTDLHEQMDTIPPVEMTWLKDDLEKNKDAEAIFLAFHSPLYMSTEYDWRPVHDLLKNYPVRAVFTGHSHIYDHRLIDGIHYFCLNTSGSMTRKNHLTGYSHCFILTSVDGSKVDFAVIADGRIFPPDAVPPDEYKRSPQYFVEETTSIIPDTSKQDVNITLSIPIHNRTREDRSYLLQWETDDFHFHFDPPGANLDLGPDEVTTLSFKIFIPRGIYTRDMLPKLKVETPYTNGAGYETTLTSYHLLFCPPETTALPLRGGFTFDGKMDDPAWQDVPAINRLFIDKKGTPAREGTTVKVIYDAENIYVGVQGEEPNPRGLKALATGKIPLVFADDDFELYFDPGRGLKTYYRLMVNPAGTVLCSGPEGLFTFHFEAKTNIGKDYWSAEFKVPYSEINANHPKPGDRWGLNIRRARQQAEATVSEWSRMRGFPAQTQYFGILNFK